jgi:hypothetical protein
MQTAAAVSRQDKTDKNSNTNSRQIITKQQQYTTQNKTKKQTKQQQ